MDVIKAISAEKKNQYKITLESGAYFQVSEDVIVKHRLLKGKELSHEDLVSIKKESQMDYGYQLSLNYISFQLRSEKEVVDYLLGKEIPKEQIDKVIDKLKELELINDLTFSESYVRTQMRLSDKGPRTISGKLRQKGVAAAVIDEALDLYDDSEQEKVALEAADKALRKYRTKSHYERIQKTRQLLMTKGFSKEIIDIVMSQLEVEKDREVEQDLLGTQGDKLWRKHQRLIPSKRKQKVIQSLFQKGFEYDLIQVFIAEKELEDGEEE